MKPLFMLLALMLSITSHSQILKQVADRAKRKVGNVVGDKVEGAIDNVANKKTSTEIKDTNTSKVSAQNPKKAEPTAKPSDSNLKSYSRFDFVPGDKIIYSEDFSQDVIGELPLKWKTNGSGELVTIDKVEGKWLKFKENTMYTAPFNTKLPDNYTLEFDMLIDFKEDQRVPFINVHLIKPLSRSGGGNDETATVNAGLQLKLKPNGGQSNNPDAVSMTTYDPKGMVLFAGQKDQLLSTFNDNNKKLTPVHIALWVQGNRVRAWVNEQKIYDLPNGMDKAIIPSQLKFEVGNYGGPQNNYNYFISNIKIAAAAPDTRNKLITEGKFSTSGILFEVNSDKIKPTSYGVLKEIAGVLSGNASVKVKIIGHTDIDGDAVKNLDLSKRRAAAVKKVLADEFNIDESRMETDGAGATKPIADNKTAEGKAQNRRVEFVKL